MELMSYAVYKDGDGNTIKTAEIADKYARERIADLEANGGGTGGGTGTGEDPTEAATYAEQAAASAEAAATSEANAADSAEAAEAAAGTATDEADRALACANEANAAAQVTGTDKTEANASAEAAEAAETAAKAAQTAAEAAKTAAQSAADTASAKATAASSSASTAASKATEASNSATAAAEAKTAAESAQSAAETAANNASDSATDAEQSADTATSKASAASTSATNAASSASTASTKATAAADSASAAKTSETNAKTSETNAATSATNAASSASTATSKASAAATSATNAANSATAAAESAQSAADNAEVAFSAKEIAEQRAASASNYADAAAESAAAAQAAADSLGGGVPDYVLTEAERVAAAVQGHQGSNTVTFLACSDIHHSTVNNAEQMAETLMHLGQGMALIRERVAVDFAACLGDSIWDASNETVENVLEAQREVNAALFDAFNGVPNFRLVGNHEAHYKGSTQLTAAQIFANTAAFNAGATFDEANRAGGYCYRDFTEKKLRVVCLNTSEGDTSGGYTMSAEQLSWLADALDLSTLGEGWRSLILSHIPLDWYGSTSAPLATVNAASGVLCNVHGHIHNYLAGTLEGTDIPRFGIPNGCFYRANEYGENDSTEYNGMEFGETTTYSKTAGTAEDTAFCVVTLDLDGLIAYADHYGAGYSREITLPGEVVSGYTNVIPAALDFDLDGVFNGIGYMDGKYLSTSSPYYNADTATVVTGLIPYKNYTEDAGAALTPPTIYVKGVTINTSNSHDRFGYAKAGSGAIQSTMNGAANWAKAWTITELSTQYYKLEPVMSGSQNGLFANLSWYTEYIAFSFTGTGENLIITLDEPIE